jgi:hypothetical protein
MYFCQLPLAINLSQFISAPFINEIVQIDLKKFPWSFLIWVWRSLKLKLSDNCAEILFIYLDYQRMANYKGRFMICVSFLPKILNQ